MRSLGFYAHLVPPQTFLDHFANIELVVGMALMILFTIFYGLFFSFGKTPAGKSIFYFFCAISLLLIYSTVSRILLPFDYPLRDIFRVVVFAALPVTMGWLFITLVRNWIKGSPVVAEVPRRNEDTEEIDTAETK